MTILPIDSYAIRQIKAAAIRKKLAELHEDIVFARPKKPDYVVWRNSRNLLPQSAELVGFTFLPVLTSIIGELSNQIDALVGAVTYGKLNTHATISAHQLRLGRVIDESSPTFEAETGSWIRCLAEVVRKVWEHHRTVPRSRFYIDYGPGDNTGLLFDGEVVILGGVPTPELDDFVVEVVEQANAAGLGLRVPWGYNITVARLLVNRRRSDPGVENLLRLLVEFPRFGVCAPNKVEVGYFNTGPETGFVLNWSETIELH